MSRSPQVPGRMPVATWDLETKYVTLDCLQALLTQAGQEIAELKEEVKAEKGKREAAEKLSSDYQESLLNVNDSLEKTKTDFAKEKETLTRRAEQAEAKLGPVTQELNTLKGYVSRLCIAVFGKSTFIIKLSNDWRNSGYC